MKFYVLNGNNFNDPNANGDRFAGVRFWLTTLLIVLTLSSLGLGWLVQGIVNLTLVLIGLAIILPAIAMIGLQWWLKRSIVTAECPVCHVPSTASKNSQFQCPSCGEPLQAENQQFVRLTPPGTIDIEVQTVD